ncbi:hypothetical protein A3752_11420 [Oleiphilus sp. HI0081]|nr:hypothetical protein A3729_12240 [Oleiphilus sp. HI0043]KZY45759.1 hypothetical protein A3732_09485 [Oleiphilus sp. HI0050]KZY52868.1 hypothetical protein A3735_05935 [Oleiphilus sp. HI0061]KZY74281.1 hypothetical protein A3740_02830 [Oleiphilus sp. HI0068]KZY81213.1 hypothetical protein A3741_17560 [Oleiphilus sp. HI0069]KZY95299.1 hypothetical protein A3743_05685 [Oleiphilus sp. HI0072]KZZ20561.1 hypothetical protein A3752_11420 [Oleiphilus sp. HI0081]KZZ20647.1 hypothetical protein A37
MSSASKLDHYRELAGPIIHAVILETGKNDVKLIRKKLNQAYPFEARCGQAYRAWLSEVHSQLGFTLRRKNSSEKQLDLFDQP